MGALGTLVLVFLILSSILMVVLILMQAGRGGGLSGAFGVGGDTSIFGAQTASVITKATAILAGVFMLSCIGLAAIEKNRQDIRFEFDLPEAPVDAEMGGAEGTGADTAAEAVESGDTSVDEDMTAPEVEDEDSGAGDDADSTTTDESDTTDSGSLTEDTGTGDGQEETE